MRIKSVLNIISLLTIFLGLSMLFPLGWAIYFGESPWPFIIPILFSLIAGGLLYAFIVQEEEIRQREGFAIVTLGWLVAVIIGIWPYILSGTFTSFVDAFFETMSGFTTTGASVLLDIEVVDRSILFWRSLTHWLGGMGIMVLFLSILGQLGTGGMQVYRAEVPGHNKEKLRPRIKETAKILWLTYVIISGAQTICLWLAGMSLFEALIHTFGTMATGGFSSRQASIGAYTPIVQWIIIFFMFLAGINFSLYYYFLRERKVTVFWKSQEFRLYLSIVLFAAVIMFAVVPKGQQSFTDAAFQVVSITTTTGYVTVDYDTWSGFARGFLVFLMFIGGCAGSTGGSMKVGRHLLLARQTIVELQRMVRPRAVFQLKIEGKTISEYIIINLFQFFFLYIVLTVLSTLIILTSGVDLVTAFTSVAACIGNVGPGLGLVGPIENYAFYGSGYKVFLSILMLVGRLEIFTVCTLLLPSTWKR